MSFDLIKKLEEMSKSELKNLFFKIIETVLNVHPNDNDEQG